MLVDKFKRNISITAGPSCLGFQPNQTWCIYERIIKLIWGFIFLFAYLWRYFDVGKVKILIFFFFYSFNWQIIKLWLLKQKNNLFWHSSWDFLSLRGIKWIIREHIHKTKLLRLVQLKCIQILIKEPWVIFVVGTLWCITTVSGAETMAVGSLFEL